MNAGIKALSSKFRGNKPKSRAIMVPFRNAGRKNYMERVRSMPIARQAAYSIGAPQFNGGKPIIVRHREYLQPIVSVTAFTGAGRYVVQPGLTDNFPWLGQIAGAFENYLFKDIKYVYRNRQGTTSNTTIYTATQYDVSDPEFSSVEEIMTYSGARSEVSWRDFAVDCNLKKGRAYKKYLIRTDALSSGMDYQPYDQALFTICAVGPSAGTYCGDLLVEYTIHLWNPKMNPNLIGAMGVNSSWLSPSSGATWAAAPMSGYNVNRTSYFASSSEPIVDEVKNTITFPTAGSYDISYHLHTAGGGYTGQSIDFTIPSASGVLSSLHSFASGITCFVKVITLVGNAVVSISSAGSGTDSGPVTSYLFIAVEAFNNIWNFLGKDPTLVVADETLRELKRYHPKCDMKAFEEANRRWQSREMKRKAIVSRPLEVEAEPEPETSDVEQEIVQVSKSKDKRSKSSERKEKLN